MEEIKQLSEKEQLIESAMQKVLQGGEINFKLAIWDLQMAKEKWISYSGGNDPNYEFNLKSDLQRRFLEILLGLNNSKDELLKLLVEGVQVKRNGKGYETIDKIEGIMFNGYRRFITNELPEIWLKSLKYDAILKELESSDSEEVKDKSQLEKIKSILGKE
jgi:hypothetical protein